MYKPTKAQRRAASAALLEAIHAVEAMQRIAAVRRCATAGLIDMSAINKAKDMIENAGNGMDE